MADLPLIPNPSPLIVPATVEAVYNELYIVAFNVQTINVDATKQPLTIVFRPYNYTTKQLYPGADQDKVEFFDNIWELVYTHPLAAQVVGGMALLFSLEYQLRQLVAAINAINPGIQTNTERLAVVSASVDASGASIDLINADILTKTERLVVVNAGIDASGETPAEELLIEKADLEASLESLNAQLAVLTEQHAVILAEKSDLEASLASLNTQLTTMTEQHATILTQLGVV
ncbi:MAG: hypothetical protein M0R80_02710 [Proteobacteria bacterium]|jgi:hypothetical protein|nr:hypothetical protein [Pseudomonadota bacterium]